MYEVDSVINNRYKIINILGHSKMAKTYLGEDNLNNNKKCVIKVLELKGLSDWKILELFERESNILKQLYHPKVPNYIDSFKNETEDNQIYYLVYEYIEGKSLATLLEENYEFSYLKVENIIKQILEILNYLHNLPSNVVHRDINPNNIIMKEDSQIYLVDFGAVKNKILNAEMPEIDKTTFVGTYGYIPLEQLVGDAIPQSDLYALGMTAIKLLTGKNPTYFPMKNLKPNYKQGQPTNILDNLIDRMIEQELDKRLKSAKEGLELLNNNYKNNNNANNVVNTDSDSYYEDLGKIKVHAFQDSISLIISNKDNDTSPIIKGLGFFLENPWIPIVIGFILSGGWLAIPLLIFFFQPDARGYLNYQYSRKSNVKIKIDKDKISIDKQLNPIDIKDITNINIKRIYNENLINLKITITIKKEKQRIFFISGLDSEEADTISSFITRNIEKRRELLT